MSTWRHRAGAGSAARPAAATGEILRIVEDEMRSRFVPAPSRGLELVNHAAGRLAASWGAVSVGALTDRAGVSGNHLATQFKSHLGVTPKRVARIYRFARLILSVDAVHKEFKDFTGHTPTAYLALRRRFPAEKGFPPDNGPMPAD